MNNNILKGMVTRCSDYSFQIGSYSFPKQIKSYSGKIIDLEDNRLQNLQQGSSWSPNFERYLGNQYTGTVFHREFPFLIDNRPLWKEISDYFGVSPSKKDRNYFLADYFFPNYNLAVEIDSRLHDPIYDQARDEYMQEMCGTTFLRFFNFSESNKYFTNCFSSTLNKINQFKEEYGIIGFIEFDNSSFALDSFYRINSDIIGVVNKLETLIINDHKLWTGVYSILLSDFDEASRRILLDPIYFKRIYRIFYTVYNISVFIKP
jgi:hypothetical protein